MYCCNICLDYFPKFFEGPQLIRVHTSYCQPCQERHAKMGTLCSDIWYICVYNPQQPFCSNIPQSTVTMGI